MSRIALVTGGTRGIGKAIALHLKDKSYTVVANYAGDDTAAQDFSKETGIKAYRWDVSDYQSCEEAVAKITAEVGAIDVLVNNAGVTRDGAMHKMKQEAWKTVIDVNLTSCFNMSRVVIDSMREKGFGRIISISSVNGQLGQFGQTNYAASKAGIFGFTKSLARESAAKGITVNAIAPGYIATDMVKAVPQDILDKIVKNIPVGRLGEPEEVARCVAFLAADDAAFITGETLSVNGGQYME
ncbi:MAG: acetoacetyl-CoA reductase [Alphaproteobacteria bacterium]|nr:acetoacetyl-CoA reductase [Alphaproteobacteria bacterium]